MRAKVNMGCRKARPVRWYVIGNHAPAADPLPHEYFGQALLTPVAKR
jgi:hypothetical protein